MSRKASKGVKVVSGRQKALRMYTRRHDAIENAKFREFEQEDAVEAPAFRLFHSENDGAIVSWFHVREADYEVEKRIIDSRLPLKRRLPGEAAEDYNFYAEVIDIPVRPAWTARMSRRRLKRNEEKYFEEYLHQIYSRFAPHRLNHFEHNLDVWRQLWRVCESSDVLMVVADSRHPMFHLPPSLYRYITDVLKKPLVLILNKVDLISSERQSSWLRYLAVRYPLLNVIPVTSYPHAQDQPNTCASEQEQLSHRQQSHEKRAHRPVGVDQVMALLEKYYQQIRLHKHDESTIPSAPSAPASSSSSDLSSSPSTSVIQREDESDEEEDEIELDEAIDKNIGDDEIVLNDEDSSEDEDDDEMLTRLSAMSHQNKHHLAQKQRAALKQLESLSIAAKSLSSQSKSASSTDSTTKFIPDSSSIDENEEVSASAKQTSKPAIKNWWQYEQEGDDDGDLDDDDGNNGFEEDAHDIRAADDERVDNESNRLIVGVLGHPNAGKSSLINAIMGRACVGVSATPGKTKHLQTIILNERFMLCDCPGLVFPAVDMPKPLQVLSAIFPLPQTREPYSIVRFLAERVPIEKIFALKPPVNLPSISSAASTSSSSSSEKKQHGGKGNGKQSSKKSGPVDLRAMLDLELEIEMDHADMQNASMQQAALSSSSSSPASSSSQPVASAAPNGGVYEWSAWDICEAFAKLKGYKLQAGGFDTYKAAHDILEDALSGVINFSFPPPSL